MSISSPSRAVRIFFSYAPSALQDKRFFHQLTTHLMLLRRQHLIDEWYDSENSHRRSITKFLETRLNMADIIVLLISADFFACDSCYEIEMQQAIALSEAGNIRLIPVLLSPSAWNTTPLYNYQPLPRNGIPISETPNRAAAFAEVASDIRLAVEEITSQATKKHIPDTLLHSSVYNAPYLSNDFFTDRASILARISSAFAEKPTNRTQVLALNGLGGIGKTQIALEYSYRSTDIYHTILWMNASSHEILSTEVSKFADHFSPSERYDEDEQQLFSAFQHWLQEQPTWLLVLDQIADMTLLDLIIPAHSHGHVLLTTRSQATRKRASAVSITSMSIDDSALFLLHRANLLPPEASLDQASADIVQEALSVALAMDGLPLALDQAGAYLEETGCSPATYLSLYHDQRAVLLSQRGESADTHPDSVTSTLALAFEQVVKKNTINLELLYLFAFLHPDAIPEELFLDGADVLMPPLQTLSTHPLMFYQALADLRSFSLIDRGADRKMQRIHRIVQAVLMDTLTEEQKRQWASQAVRMVNHVFPEVRFDTWAECQRYLPQAQHCATLIHEFQLTLTEGALLLERLGTYCARHAAYAKAETYLSQALHLYESHLQANSSDAAQTLNSLALLYYQQAQYHKAESLHKRALEIRERVLGPDHPKTAETLHNLAMLYEDLGNYQQTEQLYLRVLSLEERTKDPNHPDIASTLNNLGLTYYQLGNYPQAETMYQRALAIYEQSLSPNHPDIAYTLNGLGALAENQKKYQEAEEFYQRGLVIRQHIFGETHPDIAHSFNKLASIAQARGNYQQAETLYQQALRIGEQVLGPQHPDVALFLNNLALLAYKQHAYKQAEPLYVRSLKIYEQVLGPKSTAVASVLNNLGQLARQTNQNKRAETFLRRALVIREEILGMKHPSTAQSLSNLADLLTSQHKNEEAEPLFQQALAIRLNIFGPAHEDVKRVQEQYALLLERMNRSEEAQMLRQAPLRMDEKTPREPFPGSDQT